MATYSVNLPPELVEDVDDEVEESNVFENRSHFVRVAIREYLEESEFGVTR